MDLKNKLKLL